MAARVRLPILVTRQKFITQDAPDDTTVMDVVEDASITITNRETESPQTVYKGETGSDTFSSMEMVSNSRGRFEGWIERSLVAIEVVYGDQSYVEHFDAVPAKDGSVDGGWIADETIAAANLAPNSVTSPKLAEGAVTDTKVHPSNKDGAAGTPSMRTLGEGANQAAAGNDARLTDSRPPSGSAGGDLTGSYPNPTVGSLKITEGKIAGAAVTNAKLGTQAVERDKIKDAAVNAIKLDTDAVETAKIKNANVTRAKLAADTMDQAAGVSSLRKLDPTGADPTAAAPANDSRFTALISSANAIQTDWISNAAVTSPKMNPSIYQSSGSGSSVELFNDSSGGGLGVVAQSLSFTPDYNARLMIWATWDVSNFSTNVTIEGYMLKGFSNFGPSAIFAPSGASSTRSIVTQMYTTTIDANTTTVINQLVKCYPTTGSSGVSAFLFRPNSRITAMIFGR